MIDLVFEAILPITISLTFMLVFHKPLLKGVGANYTYYLWLIVPLSLVFYLLFPMFISLNGALVTGSDFERILVKSTQAINEISDIDWLIVSYFFIVSGFVMVGIINHLVFQKNLQLPLNSDKNNTLPFDLNKLNIQWPRQLHLIVNDTVQSPMIFGFYRPKLLLPSAFTDLYTEDQQKLILEHEICHFDRNDIYWNLIAYSFLALFWFHPLVWLAYFRFRQDQELSCDQTVLARKHLNSRINYSRALLVTAQYKPSFAIARISFNEFGDKAIMLERINQIKTTKVIKKSHSVSLALVGAIMLSGLTYAGNMNKEGVHSNHDKANNVSPVMRVEPKYPVEAAKNKVEGAVLLKFDINGNGKTENIKVINAEPAYVFDQVAIKALSQWKYEVANKKTSRDYIVQLDFRMDNSSMKPFHLVEKINVSQ